MMTLFPILISNPRDQEAKKSNKKKKPEICKSTDKQKGTLCSEVTKVPANEIDTTPILDEHVSDYESQDDDQESDDVEFDE